MAIKPGYKTFTFDGENSGDYGVYITGSAVYNAPEREVEMISIPGRNGAFALDKGRFENIEVTYPAGIYAQSQAEFAEALSDLRNMLCSRQGYCRLEDEYNPDEYRMAIYKSGLDVDPAEFQRAGQFNITFECKPQRFLTSGEEAITVENGSVINNPTDFDSCPLLEIDGYGTISFNGHSIELDDELVGLVTVVDSIDESTNDFSVSFPQIYINNNDTIEIDNAVINIGYARTAGNYSVTSATVSSWGGTSAKPTVTVSGGRFQISFDLSPTLSFSYGVSAKKTVTADIKTTLTNGTVKTVAYSSEVRYDGEKSLRFYTYSGAKGLGSGVVYELNTVKVSSDSVTIDSTATTYGHPTYIDCDLGEAYAIDNGIISSLNSYIDLGSKLPSLTSGTNSFEVDNTIIDLKVVPRWWKV